MPLRLHDDDFVAPESTCLVSTRTFFVERAQPQARPIRGVVADWIAAARVYLDLLQSLGKSPDGTRLVIRENAEPHTQALHAVETFSRELITAGVNEKLLRYESESVRGEGDRLSLLVQDALAMIYRHFVARHVPGFKPDDWITTEFADRFDLWLKTVTEWAATFGVAESSTLDAKDLRILTALKLGRSVDV